MFNRAFEDFIYPSQAKLFKRLCKLYGKRAYYCASYFILVEGTAPIMLVAHLDTVHAERVHDICKTNDGNIIMSPQGIGGDDRCGVYALCKVHELATEKPWLLFTCDEEIGGIGAKMFCKCYRKGRLPSELGRLKFLVEIDRRGANDAVYYDCDNREFEEYISGFGYQTELGSYSDISSIAPVLGIAAVNLSSGYYNAHRLHEYINRAELERTIARVNEMVIEAADKDFPRFEYIKKESFKASRCQTRLFDEYNDDSWLYSK